MQIIRCTIQLRNVQSADGLEPRFTVAIMRRIDSAVPGEHLTNYRDITRSRPLPTRTDKVQMYGVTVRSKCIPNGILKASYHEVCIFFKSIDVLIGNIW